MNTNDITRAAANIGRLDLAREQEQAAALSGVYNEITAAQEAAQARIREISNTLGAMRDQVEGSGVATALLGGKSATEASQAAVSEPELRKEISALRAGINELEIRRAAIRREIEENRVSACAKAAAAAKPLIQLLETELREAANRIASSYAAINAVTELTRGAVSLRSSARSATLGMNETDGLLKGIKHIDTPADIVRALEPLTRFGQELFGPARLPRSVSLT